MGVDGPPLLVVVSPCSTLRPMQPDSSTPALSVQACKQHEAMDSREFCQGRQRVARLATREPTKSWLFSDTTGVRLGAVGHQH